MREKKPSDYAKLYDFNVSSEKMSRFENNVKHLTFRHFRNAFIFGFFIEYAVIKSKICVLFFYEKTFISDFILDENLFKRIVIKRLG
jgi:hypothetical protein